MASTNASLSAATQDRKARLAQLKTLKRKQPSDGADNDERPLQRASKSPSPEVAEKYLSGRNYDTAVRGPKLGFENAPTGDGQKTLEAQAESLARATKEATEAEEKEDKPLDLFKLQPKKPNWDLKRDLEKKLEILNVKTSNAIAQLVRERIEKAKKDKQGGDDDMGIDGNALVEAMHAREREEELDRDNDRDDEDL